MLILLIAILAICIVLIFCVVYLARKVGGNEKKLRSITRVLFLTTQIAGLVWVSLSYVIAIYATFQLGQPFPVTDLSAQAIITILGGIALKVVENIFEHNTGGIFGESDKNNKPTI